MRRSNRAEYELKRKRLHERRGMERALFLIGAENAVLTQLSAELESSIEEEKSSKGTPQLFSALCESERRDLACYPKSRLSKDELALKNNLRYLLLDFQSIIREPLKMDKITLELEEKQKLHYMLGYMKSKFMIDNKIDIGKKGIKIPEIYCKTVSFTNSFGIKETKVFTKIIQRNLDGIDRFIETLDHMSSIDYKKDNLESLLGKEGQASSQAINQNINLIEFERNQDMWIFSRDDKVKLRKDGPVGKLHAMGFTNCNRIRLGFDDTPDNSYFGYRYVTTNKDESMIETTYINRYTENVNEEKNTRVNGCVSGNIGKNTVFEKWKANWRAKSLMLVGMNCWAENLKVKTRF